MRVLYTESIDSRTEQEPSLDCVCVITEFML